MLCNCKLQTAIETSYLLYIEKEPEHTANHKAWRKLDVPVNRPSPLLDIFAWSVGIGLALLFLVLVVYAYLLYHR